MILAVVDDLMVGVRIEEAAKTLGKSVETASSIERAAARLRSGGVDLVVVDLAIEGLDIGGVVAAARGAGAALAGFYPHVDAELRRAAEGAGVQRVYPRSRFLRELPVILRESLNA